MNYYSFDETKILTKLFDHDTNIGPVRFEGLPKHKCHGRDAESAAVEIEILLHTVQRNLERLTHQVPMATIKDLPKAMHRCVVGVPRDWVRLFHTSGARPMDIDWRCLDFDRHDWA